MKKIRIFFSVLSFVFLVLISCKQKNSLPKKRSSQEILNADRSFSSLSSKEGMKRAFIEYIDNEGILLRPAHPPIIGASAIDFLSQVNDSSYTLTWEPSGAAIAQSGELGYSYGIYKLALKDTVLKGTYVSVWQKQNDGKWKFVLDSGNEGLAEKVQ